MKPSFNQMVAAILCFSIVGALIAVIFIPSTVDKEVRTSSLLTLSGCLSSCVIFLMKAGSDKSNSEMRDKMIDALKNSTPTNQVS